MSTQTNSHDSVRVVPEMFTASRPSLRSVPPAPGSDPQVVTISAAEMVRLTGVGRERLRTWERRHDFPQPVRCRNNVRRYPAEDVRHVIAVSRAVDQGVPLAEAIEQTLANRNESPTFGSLGAALDHAPTPAIAIAGPEPLSVVWTNGATQAAPDAPEVGSSLMDELPAFGPSARATIQRLLIGEGSDVNVITHADWIGTFPAERRSVAWRVPPEMSTEAVVVLVQLPEGAAQRHVPGVPGSSAVEQTAVWGAAAREARKALQQEHGIASAQRALSELVKGTGGADAFLATIHAGHLRTATSVRGTIPPKTIDIAGDCDIARAIADAEVDWLGDESLKMLGVPLRTQAIVVPIICGHETIGGMFLLFNDELPLADITRELLQSLATTVGAVLQRERNAAAAEAARAAVTA
ncbi:MAG: MerR family transcriptional regulator [Solirubrobacteraceae bacterium]|nr:MerR family transcriptional regulator [Solirubrobacteraceae bacterium]